MAQNPDLSTWLTRPEACAFLGVSPKTIERYEHRGLIHQRKRPVLGRKPMSVYDPDALKHIKEAMTDIAVPAVVVHDTPNTSREVAIKAPPNALDVIIGKAIDAVVAQAAKVRVSEKLYLTVREAAEYSGLPMAEIRRMLNSDVSRGQQLIAKRLPGAGWRIRRDSLGAVVV